MFLYSPVGMGSLDNYFVFLKIHWLVSIKDALMILVVYGLVSLLRWNWQWPQKWNWGWVVFLLALPLWQAAVEYHAVYLAGRWAYNELMPLIFGIGLSPILQMLILPSIAILISRHIFSNSIEWLKGDKS